MKEIKIQWHPGFVAAVNLELAANRNDLIYEKEYNLNTKPLEIDLLVIKKDSHVQITNETGRLFKGHNILEYRSPEDHLDIDSFYKAGAYASLYKAYGETVERKADDITVSMVRETKPDGLFQYFSAHQTRLEEFKGEGAMCQALLEIMEPEINQIVMQATEKAGKEADQRAEEAAKRAEEAAQWAEEAVRKAKQEAEETARKMIKSRKFSIEEIREYVPRLSVEEIQEIAGKLAV